MADIDNFGITARKQPNVSYCLPSEKMLDGCARCKMLFNDSGQPVDFVYLYVNSAFEKLTGLKDVIGRKVTEVIPGIRESHPEIFEVYGRVVSTGQPERFEVELKSLAMWLTISVLRSEKEHFVAVFDVINERKRVEQAHLQSEKLAFAGRIAAVIAHEINNPLEAVTNLLFIVSSIYDLPESARQYLEIADDELKRIAHLVARSLGFYRGANAPALTSINAVLESTVDLLQSRIKAKQAVIEKQWDEDVQIPAVAGELLQVFSNLLANSVDAIGEKGMIKLRVSGVSLKNGHSGVRVTIADNGNGISARLRQQIFKPFVTTKGTIGIGLGLWSSKQIIDKHDGNIRVRSNTHGARRGTTFSVVLPVEPAAAPCRA